MWHIIYLCLPAVTRSEQQRFFTLFKEVLHAYGREPGEMDLSLFFLYVLSPEEALTVLEEREQASDDMQALITDHMRTRLPAQYAWLQRAIAQLQHQSGARIEAVVA